MSLQTDVMKLDTISARIRHLHNLGLETSQIKTLLESWMDRKFRYQHVRNVIMQDLKKGPVKRRQTAEEILEALES